jgi:anti-sigma28 factor (negative regulator of flagellin synthesis)
MPARLQVIHDLIRSGDYHVPATAIADRMIEQMIVDKREPKS